MDCEQSVVIFVLLVSLMCCCFGNVIDHSHRLSLSLIQRAKTTRPAICCCAVDGITPLQPDALGVKQLEAACRNVDTCWSKLN